MAPQPPLREAERANYAFFLILPESTARRRAWMRRVAIPAAAVRVLGRVRGCGETPYIKLLTQLFGDRADRERHGLLINLRRQSADDAVTRPTAKAAGPRGPTRCSKTTRSLDWACIWWIATSRPRGALAERLLPISAALCGGLLRRISPTRPGSQPSRTRAGAAQVLSPIVARAGGPSAGRLPRPEPCGLSAAMGGHTTSATVDLITCSRSAAT